ncbi:SGNH hydrolase-type esterase domain-containing protein [Pseudomassariella vexata]|uniref:SGNH hydrolase-type esterase domain-containing protein n=1 Tax=Pseudomassariella vexata TaxID=1141098 RepID=A0A1Y2DX41_9PEZI|nr:SGNH hydrolase-type esterase domain-containing protein [Pseudomassariella vexata]ORY63841.1 SGNH hydrolase-type esterase domain-containing protein [Pseudomassariella vexata]
MTPLPENSASGGKDVTPSTPYTGEPGGHVGPLSSQETPGAEDVPVEPRWLLPQSRLNSSRFRCFIALLTLVLFIVIIVNLGPAEQTSNHPKSKIKHFASLGSSFAAGPGIPPQVNPRAAGRSGHNYGALLAAHLGDVTFTDLSVSGATLLNLITQPQLTSGHVFAPQVYDLPADVDLVLVLGGGNDLDYIGGLMRDHGAVVDSWGFWDNNGEWVSGPKTVALGSADALARRYETVLDAVHTAAPQAIVLVIEYLTLLGQHFQPGQHAPFGYSRAAYHMETAEMLHNGTLQAVQGREAWCHVVEVARLSEAHGIGSPEPWVTDFRGISIRAGDVPYHPNLAGMKAVESMLFHKLVQLDLIA